MMRLVRVRKRLPAVIAMTYGSAMRRASLLLLLGCACPQSSTDAAEDKPPASRLDVPPPKPPAFDPSICDRALKRARKCAEDSTFDSDVKAKLVATVVDLSALWALRNGLPPEQQQVQCKRILDGVKPIVRQTGCENLPELQRTIEP